MSRLIETPPDAPAGGVPVSPARREAPEADDGRRGRRRTVVAAVTVVLLASSWLAPPGEAHHDLPSLVRLAVELVEVLAPILA